jgi:hypothetical protein
VSRWTRENIQPHDAKLAVVDRASLNPVGAEGGSAGQGCTPDGRVRERRLVALEVLGGRIPTLDLRAQVDLQDGRMGVVVAQGKNDKAWVATHTSFFESDDKMLFLKSPYTGHLGPESLKLLLPWIVSMRDDLFAPDVPYGSEANKSIILQLRMLRAVCEYSAAYDGYGADGNSGEFSTMGAREIAETLLEEKLLSPITQLALNAGQYQSLRWAVAALEECVTALERVGVELEDSARNVSASESSNPKIRLRLQGGAGSGADFGASTAASAGGSRFASHSRIVQLQQHTVRSTTPSTSAGSTSMLATAAASTSTTASTAGHGTPSASATAPSATIQACVNWQKTKADDDGTAILNSAGGMPDLEEDKGGAQHSIESQLPAILDDMRKHGNGHAEHADACLRILSLAPCVEEAEWSKTLRSFQLSCELQYLRMDELGVTDLLLKVMEAGTLHAPLAIAVCKVLNVLGRHLTIRAKLLSSGWLPRVLAVMGAHPASSVQEAALNALSQIISSAFAEKKNQTLELLLNAMRVHHGDRGVQRAACIALSRISKLQNMALSAPDKADAQMAAKIFDLVLSAMQKYSEDSFLQATGCAAIGVLAGPTPKDSDLGVARQAQLGKAFDRILAALQAPNGNRDVHQAACATLLELDLNHSYLMRINAADAAVCNISLAMSASEASDTDKNECKQRPRRSHICHMSHICPV